LSASEAHVALGTQIGQTLRRIGLELRRIAFHLTESTWTSIGVCTLKKVRKKKSKGKLSTIELTVTKKKRKGETDKPE
jgi:hypothetical protein